MKKIIILAAMALLCSAGAAQADIAYPGAIAGWNMGVVTGQPVTAAGIGSDHVIAYDMTRGAGLSIPTATNYAFNSSGWTGEATDYVQFGFNVANGYKATLDKLYFGTKASGQGPTQLYVKTSKDGYQSTVYTVTQDNAGGTSKYPGVDLSSLGPVTGDFYVRLYGASATSGGTMRITAYNNGTFYYDSITGSVTPTPIPAAAFLFGSGLLGLAGVRRRK